MASARHLEPEGPQWPFGTSDLSECWVPVNLLGVGDYVRHAKLDFIWFLKYRVPSIFSIEIQWFQWLNTSFFPIQWPFGEHFIFRHSEIQTLRAVILLVIHSSHEYPIKSSFSTVKPPRLYIDLQAERFPSFQFFVTMWHHFFHPVLMNFPDLLMNDKKKTPLPRILWSISYAIKSNIWT